MPLKDRKIGQLQGTVLIMNRMLVPKQMVIYVCLVVTTLLLVSPYVSFFNEIRTVQIVEPTTPPWTIPPVCTWTNPDQYIYWFTPRYKKITPLGYTQIKNVPENTCGTEPVDMVILVVTRSEHSRLRNMIRSTWGTVTKNPSVINNTIIKVIFLLGQHTENKYNLKVSQEANVHNDILFYDFKESYFNLTIKVMLGFKWVEKYCPQTKFVLKVDDDTYLNLPGIFQRLQSPDWNTKICGHYSESEPAVRDIKSKARVSYEAYPFVNFPSHVKGRTYFMPGYMAKRIAAVAEYIPYCNMEDVHVTGILAKSAGIVHHKGLTRLEYHPYEEAKMSDVISGQTIVSSVNTPEMGFYFYGNRTAGFKH